MGHFVPLQVQPSPSIMFPSSHCSPTSRMPSPQNPATTAQSMRSSSQRSMGPTVMTINDGQCLLASDHPAQNCKDRTMQSFGWSDRCVGLRDYTVSVIGSSFSLQDSEPLLSSLQHKMPAQLMRPARQRHNRAEASPSCDGQNAAADASRGCAPDLHGRQHQQSGDAGAAALGGAPGARRDDS